MYKDVGMCVDLFDKLPWVTKIGLSALRARPLGCLCNNGHFGTVEWTAHSSGVVCLSQPENL